MPGPRSPRPARARGGATVALVTTFAVLALLATGAAVVLHGARGGERPPVPESSAMGGTAAASSTPGTSTPASSAPGTSASGTQTPTPATTALLSRVSQSATRLVTTPHTDHAEALADWTAFAEDLVAAQQTAPATDLSSAVALAVATAVSTPQGRAALTATEQALDGEVLVLPEARTDGPEQADRAVRAAGTTPRVRVYFVNGVLNDVAQATAAAAALGRALGVHVDLAYNRSVLQADEYAVDLCLRGVVAGYRAHPGVGDYGSTTIDELATEAGRNLQAAGDAALTVACRVADSVLTAANFYGQKAEQLLRSGTELTLQWLADSRVVSAPVNQKLERLLKGYLGRGDRVLLVGHSQGTMFVRQAQQDLNAWWPTAVAAGDITGCEPGTSATDAVRAPVAALYVSPAFWAQRADSSDLQSGLQRYVALDGDVLGRTGVARVLPTVEPMDRQVFALPGDPADYPQDLIDALADINSLQLHLLATYLMDDSSPTTSRRQVIERYAQLRDALLAPDLLTGCDAAEATTSPTTGSTDASSWVVWRALEPFEGVGVNVTGRDVYDTPQIASRYSGGGLDPTATFEKELFIDQEFGSRTEAMTALCSGLTDVRVWPLGQGLHGVWQGTAYYLGDTVECPQG